MYFLILAAGSGLSTSFFLLVRRSSKWEMKLMRFFQYILGDESLSICIMVMLFLSLA